MVETMPRAALPPARSLWNNPTARAVIYQIMVLGGVIALAVYLVDNVLINLAERSIRSGFGFLNREAGFELGESLIAYDPSRSYARAYFAGFVNTMKVSFVGIVVCSLLGLLVGIARLSRNWLVAKLAAGYVEAIRNVPILLQLVMWYGLIINILPPSTNAIELLPRLYLSKSGLLFPLPLYDPAHLVVGAILVLGIAAAVVYSRWSKRRQEATGKLPPQLWPILGLVAGPPVAAFLIAGAPLQWEIPVFQRFRFVGGGEMTPEFLALTAGLGIYTSAFVAEVVRSGILAIDWGQSEAASALGLRRGPVLRLVVLPQALRVIIPPTTNQYLNLTKNSSLAVSVGYPDLTAVSNTSLNQTGQAVECIAIMMAIYLTLSLAISAGMNLYNRAVAIPDRPR
ncbi:MAG: ABC transporter permease subunit [Alphaproteobacteria bacterium]|nr:ABC transporter permease subunit [Alphaproteobacteria bacterium]